MIVKFLQWNIWYKSDIEKIASFIQRQDCDVICLQELMIDYGPQSRSDTPKYIADKLGYDYCVQVLHKDPSGWSQANGIFSKFKIMRFEERYINKPTGNEGYDDEFRGYLEACIKVSPHRTHIWVATTHMSYTHAFEETASKKLETNNLLDCINTRKGEPYIFSGDLNSLPGSYTVKKLHQALSPGDPSYATPTWTTKPFSYKDYEAIDLDKRIDYVFCGKKIKLVSSKIYQTTLSDHLPIVSIFEL